MKILLTGGSGFIGRNLAAGLEATHQVLAPSSTELDLLDAAAVDAYFRQNRVEAVIHCATWDATWNSTKDRSLVLEHNLRMAVNLARHSDRFHKLIFLGSGAEYDRLHWQPMMTEDYFGVHVPQDAYGFSKYLINHVIGGLDNAVNLRLFGVFGKYEDWNTRFISNAICRALYNLPITINQDVAFDYLFVDDLPPVVEWFLGHSARHVAYNVCTGAAHRLTDLAAMVLDSLGKTVPVSVRKAGLGREYSGDNARLLAEVGPVRFTPIEAAIRNLSAWYRAHLDRISYRALQENARFEQLARET